MVHYRECGALTNGTLGMPSVLVSTGTLTKHYACILPNPLVLKLLLFLALMSVTAAITQPQQWLTSI